MRISQLKERNSEIDDEAKTTHCPMALFEVYTQCCERLVSGQRLDCRRHIQCSRCSRTQMTVLDGFCVVSNETVLAKERDVEEERPVGYK